MKTKQKKATKISAIEKGLETAEAERVVIPYANSPVTMQRYYQNLRYGRIPEIPPQFHWSSIKPSARKWFWVIVVAAILAFLVLFGILRYKMKFSVADSGYIGWLFTVRAILMALISTALILLAVLVTVGTAIYRRDKHHGVKEFNETFAGIPLNVLALIYLAKKSPKI